MKSIKILSALILFASHVAGQNYEKVIYRDSTNEEYFLVVPPKSDEVIGALILLPGFGQAAESIFPESKIHNVAYANGILTIAIAGGRKLYLDDAVTEKLNKALAYIKNRYNLTKDKFVIGGFSAGGTISLRYSEYCFENETKAPIEPKGVFTVDSPVDLFDIWNYFQREIRKNYSEAGVGEAKFVMEIMQNEIGNPLDNKETYEHLTPFNTTLEVTGNEQYLKNIGVRVYHDIDVVWQLKNRRRSLFDSNALASSELINRLLLLGNESAEFVPAKQKGYRSSGFRHPHSWSIVDEVELIQWVKKNLEN